MQTIKYLFNAINYLFFVFYSFTMIDVVKKITFGEFYLSNATNFLQFLMTLIAVFFAYYKLRSYIRDSRIKSKLLERDLKDQEMEWLIKHEELRKLERENFPTKWNKEFLEPKKNEK